MERLIFHVDVNSAFLSWEAARRVKNGDRDLRLIPSCIGGDPSRRTGVVLAKSIPAKERGVKTGEPLGMALRKCPDLYCAKPDFALYERNSRAFIDVCHEYAPVLEKFSIDECFLDLSGTSLLYPDPVALAHTIKNRIRDTLGFTVNIGIGPNKLLAKMAGDFEKPDRVHTLFYPEVKTKMWPLPVDRLLSVGGSTARKLKKVGVHTIGDLAHTEWKVIQSLLGCKLGKLVYHYANGQDDSPVAEIPPEPKGYHVSTTLEEDVTTWEGAYPILLSLTDSAACRMRADGKKAGCVAVILRTDTFLNRSHQHKLKLPIDGTLELYQWVKSLFGELWNGKTPLRLLGVALSDVADEECEQTSLFADPSRKREREIDRTVDAIRHRFGGASIQRGSTCYVSRRVGQKYDARMGEGDFLIGSAPDETNE